MVNDYKAKRKEKMIITDLRTDNTAIREKWLIGLAEDILWQGFLYGQNHRFIVGEYINRTKNKWNALGMRELKSHHFQIADWGIKKLLGKHSCY